MDVGVENSMGKEVSFGDEHYKKRLADFMQEINPKPQGKEWEKLLAKYMDARKPKGAGEVE